MRNETTGLRRIGHPMIDAFTDEYLEVYAGHDDTGGCPHYYHVRAKEGVKLGEDTLPVLAEIFLQEGHTKEVGVNGIGMQTLLLIALDFLQKAQEGEFRCRETAVTITKIEEAMQWNKQRELDRKQRGVLQTYQK